MCGVFRPLRDGRCAWDIVHGSRSAATTDCDFVTCAVLDALMLGEPDAVALLLASFLEPCIASTCPRLEPYKHITIVNTDAGARAWFHLLDDTRVSAKVLETVFLSNMSLWYCSDDKRPCVFKHRAHVIKRLATDPRVDLFRCMRASFTDPFSESHLVDCLMSLLLCERHDIIASPLSCASYGCVVLIHAISQRQSSLRSLRATFEKIRRCIPSASARTFFASFRDDERLVLLSKALSNVETHGTELLLRTLGVPSVDHVHRLIENVIIKDKGSSTKIQQHQNDLMRVLLHALRAVKWAFPRGFWLRPFMHALRMNATWAVGYFLSDVEWGIFDDLVQSRALFVAHTQLTELPNAKTRRVITHFVMKASESVLRASVRAMLGNVSTSEFLLMWRRQYAC